MTDSGSARWLQLGWLLPAVAMATPACFNSHASVAGPDACRLITHADVRGALGLGFGEGKSTSAGPIRQCRYERGAAGACAVAVDQTTGRDARSLFDHDRAATSATRPSSASSYSPQPGLVRLFSHGTYLSINVDCVSMPAGQREAAASRLVSRAKARL